MILVVTIAIRQNHRFCLAASFVKVAQRKGHLLWDQFFPGGDSKVLYNFVANRTVRLTPEWLHLGQFLKVCPCIPFFRPMTGSYRKIMKNHVFVDSIRKKLLVQLGQNGKRVA